MASLFTRLGAVLVLDRLWPGRCPQIVAQRGASSCILVTLMLTVTTLVLSLTPR